MATKSYDTLNNKDDMMESDQYLGDQSTLVEEEAPSAFKVWRYVSLFSVLAIVVLVAVANTTYGNGKNLKDSSSSSSSSKTESNNVHMTQMLAGGRVPFKLLDEDTKSALFTDFVTKYGKKYKSDQEQSERFANFKVFLEEADSRNTAESEAGGTAVHGITKYADLSHSEISTLLLGYKPVLNYGAVTRETASVKTYSGTATLADWSESLATPVKNQGYCGSCWAFSATEQIESDSIRLGLLTVSDSLSPQQIVSCDTTDLGCNGGNTETAYDYVMKAGGLESSTSYPYTSYYGTTGSCYSDSTKNVITISKYSAISGSNSVETENLMKSYVLSTGPLSVCLDASNWSSYTSGILSSCGTVVDHCVQVTGVDTNSNYWIVRNSWGTDWGVNGYIYLKLDSNTCRIAYDPTYTTPTKA